MDENLPKNRYFSPVLLRIGLLLILVATIATVFSSVAWIYRLVDQSSGPEIAEVVVAFLFIVILGLIAVGFRTAIGARQDLKQHKCRARRIYRLGRRSYMFRALWGHVGLPSETQPKIAAIRPVLATYLSRHTFEELSGNFVCASSFTVRQSFLLGAKPKISERFICNCANQAANARLQHTIERVARKWHFAPLSPWGQIFLNEPCPSNVREAS